MNKYLFATLTLATVHAMAVASTPTVVDEEGYAFEGAARVTGWRDDQGHYGSDAVCTQGRVLLLSNGLTLRCQNSGRSSAREVQIFRRGDYFKVQVGSDTFLMHK